MKKFKLLVPALLIIAGCSSSQNTIDRNTSDQIESSEQEPVTESTTKLEKAPRDWHHQNQDNRYFIGIGTDSAYSNLLYNKQPSKKVIVAVIDSGTDIEHEDLAENIWINGDEIPDNGKDDDNNGYIDDIHGWNFIGGKNGQNVEKDTYELTRIYVDLKNKYSNVEKNLLSDSAKEEYERFIEVKNEFEKERKEAKQNFQNLSNVIQAINGAKQIFDVASIDSVSNQELKPNSNDGPYLQQAKQIVKYFRDLDLTEQDIQDTYEQTDKFYNYAYNPEFDPRDIVGDDFDDLENRFYGNNDVEGPRSDHGTHVAGIIGAIRNNAIGMNGIAPEVSLMIIRAVPDGDERDKDIGNAIRYAVENGANIINTSFGKSYSPRKFYVDEALQFADENDVLIINAAGNSSQNVDSIISYPNKFYEDGGMMKNFITVGASSWMGDSTTAASFSNYGNNTVDLFAPGVDIYSTTPNDTYKANSGTSMASPVVAGVAALIMSYFPDLSAYEVKEILLNSVTPYTELPVYRPGTKDPVPFSNLSATGGIVNVFNAIKLAQAKSKGAN